MFSALITLVELIEKKWSESRQPRRRLAKAITTLYASLSSCQEAYLRYRSQPNYELLRRWAMSIDALVVTLNNLDDTLEIFAPEVREELNRYVMSERRAYASIGSQPEQFAEQGLNELASLVEGQPSQVLYNPNLAVQDDEDFSLAVKKLGEFIRTHFKIEEIYG
jgi:hypothetical protein